MTTLWGDITVKNITHYNQEWLEEGIFPPPHFPGFLYNFAPWGSRKKPTYVQVVTRESAKWWGRAPRLANPGHPQKPRSWRQKTNMMVFWWLKDQARIDLFLLSVRLVWLVCHVFVLNCQKRIMKEEDKKTSEVYDNPSIVICGSTVLQIEQYLSVAIWILNMLQYLPIHDSENPYPYIFVCIHSVLRLLSTCSQHSSSGLDGASANVGFTLLQGMLQEENLPCSCTYCVLQCFTKQPDPQYAAFIQTEKDTKPLESKASKTPLVFSYSPEKNVHDFAADILDKCCISKNPERNIPQKKRYS